MQTGGPFDPLPLWSFGLSAGMLPEPHQADVQDLLRECVNVRLEPVEPGKLGQGVRRSEELYARLWARATAVGVEQPDSVVVGRFSRLHPGASIVADAAVS